ncbi:AMP-binding protein [Streptomyces muensis]|uniref:AMP-binding protein n=1 Tax=Streptomyces muensis TaxID=1077944 RepID=A0A9X1PRR1_STRM4|nr:AMP-binding protein [Streptomyces muensis]MCF1592305.1 AMP-binding protein [Streptomyces muensis]
MTDRTIDPQDGKTLPTTPLTAPARWLDVPEVSAEVAALRARFTAPGLSVASVLCDEHPRDKTAFFLVDSEVRVRRLTFGELADESRRLATALRRRGIGRGDRVGVLMSKRRELPIVLLALWRLGAVHVPLFTAFAAPAVSVRVLDAGAKLIVTEPDQRQKVDGLGIPVLEAGDEISGLVASHDPIEESVAVGPDGLFIQLYTSGTTGTPKGVGVPGQAIGAFISYMQYGLQLLDTDTFWNAADPGWAYGLYFGIVGPLATGCPNVLLSAGFSVELTAKVVTTLGVSNFAAAPTVYRALKNAGVTFGHSPIRVASSAGEPLTPDVTAWAPSALGTAVMDHFGQTEQGMVIVNAWDPRLRGEVRAGSMGQALPGFVAGTVGQAIALSVEQSPLMWFTGYVNSPQQTRERYTPDGAWYLTGDIGREDAGDFFFASRDDDVILAAGYRIGPFDIESILTSDPAVAEAAVVGRPDEIRGEVVEAFIVVTPDADTGDALRTRLQNLVRSQYGAHAYPRKVHVVDSLPKTPSGKVQRFILRGLTDDEVKERSKR